MPKTEKRVYKSTDVSFFLNTGTEAVPVWSYMNTGVTSLPFEYNTTTEEYHFIGDTNATTETTGSNKSVTIEITPFTGDTVGEYIADLFFRDKLDAKSQLLEVYKLLDGTEPGSFKAKVSNVAVQLDNNNYEGGAGSKYNITLNVNGDAIFGDSKIGEDSLPVFTPAA